MHSEGPLKKKYDRKCVPVRRVSSWEREQIEKRQRHLKNFKGVKWQKLNREDELRRAKAAADGIRYVRLSSKNPHKPRGHLTHQPTKTLTHNEIAHSTYRPAPKRYRFRREPPPPTPITLENLKKFRMDEKKKRKDDDDAKFEKRIFAQIFKTIENDPTSKVLRKQVRCIEQLREKSPPRQTDSTLDRAEKQLFQLIKDHGYPSDIKLQSRTVQRLHAGPTLPAPATAGEDASERSKPAQPEQRREAAGPSPAPAPADKDASEGSEPAEREHGRARETAGHSPAPIPADEDIRERSKPIKAEHGERLEIRREDTSLNVGTRHKHFPKVEASALSLGGLYDIPSPPRHARQPFPAPKPDHILKQEDKRSTTPLEATTRHEPPPNSQASASSIGDSLDPPSPPRHATRPVPELNPDPIQKKGSKLSVEPIEPGTRHKPPPKSQAPASSVGDPLGPPSPVRHARQSAPASNPSQVYQQENKRPWIPLDANTGAQYHAAEIFPSDRFDPTPPSHRHRQTIPAPKLPQGQRQETKQPDAPFDAGTRHRPPPKSVESAYSIGNPVDAPSPQLARQPMPALKPFYLHRQENARPSTAPEASAPVHKRPQSNVSTSLVGSAFDLATQPPQRPQVPAGPSPSPRHRQPVLASRPSKLQQQQTARPSRAPEASARVRKRPQSNASTPSSIGSRFNSPSQPPRRSQAPSPSSRARQPTPLSRPSQLNPQETVRPRTARESSAPTNKRPRSSASVSSRTSTFAVLPQPSRGRQRARSTTPPPPKRRRRRRDDDSGATPQSRNRYPSSDSPSPHPPAPRASLRGLGLKQ
ncbi:hypothetical protein GMDG_01149 [Pseudogymnoascus destructans 20631-21]|uniref:Uncharacterized protein n=1 Tax=Pseudogymnoascus destructans (strain ATCC MYA-4855 / 20631-21) TaxID=658429 RepID=L8FR28_PSED2|nr:hypothetical protein GMDG_01149 [Pseudogymnoascus destructans 20631-21]